MLAGYKSILSPDTSGRSRRVDTLPVDLWNAPTRLSEFGLDPEGTLLYETCVIHFLSRTYQKRRMPQVCRSEAPMREGSKSCILLNNGP